MTHSYRSRKNFYTAPVFPPPNSILDRSQLTSVSREQAARLEKNQAERRRHLIWSTGRISHWMYTGVWECNKKWQGHVFPKKNQKKNGGMCPTFHSRIRVALLPNNRTKQEKNNVVFFCTCWVISVPPHSHTAITRYTQRYSHSH